MKRVSMRQARKIVDRFQNLRLNMFLDPRSPHSTFPRLKGRAAEVRNLGPGLLAAFQQHMDSGSQVDKQIKLALKASVRFEEILTEHKDAVQLPESAVVELQSAVHAFLMCCSALAHKFREEGRPVFNVTVKFHYLAHAALQAKHLNPRLGWCYAGEDYMAKIKRVAASCLRGTPAHLVSGKMAAKYVQGMHARLQ